MVAVGGTASKSSGMMGKMSRTGRLTCLLGCAFLAWGCLEPPPSFRLLALEDARALVHAGGVAIVEAIAEDDPPGAPLPGEILWRVPEKRAALPPEVPPGPVLVVASSQLLAYRAAAALARSRNDVVHVLITASAEERGTLYALDPQPEEIPRGRDS